MAEGLEGNSSRAVRGRSALILAAAAAALGAVAVAASPASAQSIWDGDGPWGPGPEFGTQPRLSGGIPDPAPGGAYAGGDFDRDGVRNHGDNCLLVPNPGQAPAVASASGPVGPKDMLQLAERWKREHPNARFRTDRELGEACSGYNQNYLRTTKALIESPHPKKLRIFRFLGRSGPMFGGSRDPLSSNPAPGSGNLVAALPMCSGWEEYYEFGRWIFANLGLEGDSQELRETFAQSFPDCGNDALVRTVEDWGMRGGWAGKRLYTNAEGGRITNRFFPLVTELPGFDSVAELSANTAGVQDLKLFPYANGQTRHGLIFRGRSTIDGRDTILMDWRGPEAWPANFALPGALGWLIYDECRAIQTGVYHCTAVIDAVGPNSRHLFQEGYMPWVAKGPPSIEEYIAAIR